MKTAAVRLVVAAVGLSVFSTIAVAGHDSPARKRKVGFFASLFGERTPRYQERRRRQPVFGKDWWSGDDDVSIISGSENDITRRGFRRQFGADGDPEGDPGYGMGNLTYVADKLVPLGGATFATPRPAGLIEAMIFDALADGELGIRTLPESRDAVLSHYRTQNFRPLWLDGGKLSARGHSLMKVLAAAGEEGLDPQNYVPPVLQSFESPVPEDDFVRMARLDIGLTAMAVKYARHMSGGQFDPRRLSLYNDITPAWVPASQALKVLAWSPFLGEYLASLAPKHQAYAAMKAALAELRKAGTPAPVEAIAAGKTVKVGQTDARLPAVRQRLKERGFGDQYDIPEDPMILDEALSGRLKDFQKSAGVKTSGLLGNKTIEALNRNAAMNEMPRLLDNMERLRWLPKNLGARQRGVAQQGDRRQAAHPDGGLPR